MCLVWRGTITEWWWLSSSVKEKGKWDDERLYEVKKDNGKGKQTGQECQLGKATGTVQDRVGWRVRIEVLGAF